MIDAAICELAPLVGVRQACEAAGEAQARWYHRHRHSPAPARPARSPAPQPRALSVEERVEILDVLHSDEHVDEAPATVYAKLLDEGRYLASVPTIYRILRSVGEVKQRRRPSRPSPRSERSIGVRFRVGGGDALFGTTVVQPSTVSSRVSSGRALHRGRIVEQGTYSELLLLDGHYRRLHLHQSESAPSAFPL